jgi:hypothetical protein
MEPVHIAYRIKLSDKVTEMFDFELDGETFELVGRDVTNPPPWTALGFKQCPNCPLKVEEHPHCPMALQLHDVVQRFHKTSSIDEVELEVITEQRRIIKKTALQNAISSMLGLLFPISGCPKTEGMKPLARFHVPMASEEETVFHVAGMYLLAQYFVNLKNKNGVLSFDGLITMYDDLHIVNKAVASRLQSVTSSDSVKNAITLIDMYSSLIPMLLQDQLAEMRGFFSAYLPEGEIVVPTSNYLEQAKAFRIMPTTEEEQEDVAATVAAELRAEKEKEVLDELKAMPDWLKQSMFRQAMDEFKPDEKLIKERQAAAIAAAKANSPANSAADSGKASEGNALKYSEFVMKLELEPMAEEKPPVEPAKPEPHIPPVKPTVAAAIKPEAVKPPEAKPAIQLEIVKPEEAKPDQEEDGGLKMIDFEP